MNFREILLLGLMIWLSQLVLSADIESPDKRSDQDSYIDALQKTHAEDALNSRVMHRDYSVSPHPGYSYNPPPSVEYGVPSSSYGPAPYPSFEAPTQIPPFPYHYGPRPINVYNYGPTPQRYPVVHSAPRDEHWLLDKFKFKLDLFTIGKILIKLIIFKKIVKFIALICLLLFLPRLQSKHMNIVDLLAGEDDSDEDSEQTSHEKRSFDFGSARQRQINEVSKFAMTAIESFTDQHLVKCGNLSDIPCRFQSMVDVIDDKYPYERIIQMFVPIDPYYLYKPQPSIVKPNRGTLKKQSVESSSNRTASKIDEKFEVTATAAPFNELSPTESSSSSFADYSNINRI